MLFRSRGASYSLGRQLYVGGNSPFTYEWTANGEIVSTEANPSVTPDVTTRYFLVVTDINGCSATPVSILITVRDPKNGDYDEELLADGIYNLDVYPNPATDDVNINANFVEEINLNIKITNTLGQDILNLNNIKTRDYQNQLDVSKLPAGVYLIQFNFDGKTIMRKFIKQ